LVAAVECHSGGRSSVSSKDDDDSSFATPSSPQAVVGMSRRVRVKDLLQLVPDDDKDAQERLKFLLKVRWHLKKRLLR